MITSAAGTRLAKARAAVLHVPEEGKDPLELSRQMREFIEASRVLADELIANGYHDLDRGEG